MIVKRKLAFKISLYILMPLLAVYCLIFAYDYRISKKIILNEVSISTSILSQSTLHEVENFLLPPRVIPDNLAALLNIGINPLNDLENQLKVLVRTNDDIFGCCIAFEPYAYREDLKFYAPYCYRSGDSVIFKDLGKDSYNYTNWDWYQLPRKNGPGWGEPYFDKGGGNITMITYSVPFFYNDDNHKLRGVVTVDLSLNRLNEVIRNMKVYKTGYAFLLSSTGMVISYPDSTARANKSIFTYAQEQNLPELAVIAHEMIDGATGFKKYYSFKLMEECYIFYNPLKSNGWSLAIVIPEKVIMADIYSLFQRITLFGIAGFLIILIIIVIISRNITTPLGKLASATRLIGTGNFNAKLPEIHSKDEIGQLADSFLQMRGQLTEYIRSLEEATAARQKIESELKIAFDIQQTIIPKTFPPFPQRTDIDIYASLVPALQVGGDLYDYFFVDDDLLAICIGDVSGKGIPASLMMAITRTLFRSRTHKNMNASDIVRDMNSDLVSDNKKAMFITFFLGLLNLRTGELQYCNAGHNYPYILKENATLVCLNTTHGIPLGIESKRPYGNSKVKLGSNDKLVLYTDGVSEAMDREGGIYTEQRLEKVLSDPGTDLTVKDITLGIFDDLADFTRGAEQSDDITLLVMSFRPDKRKNSSGQDRKHEIYLKNDLSELKRLNIFLEDAGRHWNLGSDLLFELNMAAEEVVSNIIHYGYKEKETVDEIHVELSLAGEELKIRITDHATAFNPLRVPLPADLEKPARERKVGGLGIFFTRKMMDKVEYFRENDCNILVLTKNIISASGEAENIENID